MSNTFLSHSSSNRNMSVTQTTLMSFVGHISGHKETLIDASLGIARSENVSTGASVRRTGRLAERVGFEPTDHITAINALAGRPIRPLWHLSWEPRSEPRYPRPRNGGRADECSRLESGRTERFRGFESPPFRPIDLVNNLRGRAGLFTSSEASQFSRSIGPAPAQ